MVAGDSAPRSRLPAALTILTVAPMLLVFVASGWIVLGAAAGASPFWPEPSMTMSEAAGVGNAGEVVRLITIERLDPNRAWPVREGILGAAGTLTPLEAAVAIRRGELVRVLLQHGALPPAAGPARTTLICRADAIGDPEVTALLVASDGGSDPRADCPGGTATR